MENRIVHSKGGVTILGGGRTDSARLAQALALAPVLVAADGGAAAALELGHIPEAVIGDMDSLEPAVRARIPPAKIHAVGEQETTDFEKCVQRIEAYFLLAVGLTGGRQDHELAALNVMVRHPTRAILVLGEADVTFLAPPRLSLDLPPGTRLSLFPMGEVRAQATGLRWPVEGIRFSPLGRIGTSNEVTGPVAMAFEGDGMLVILPAEHLAEAIRALTGQVPVRER